MENYKLFDAEFKFMNIIWDNEPIASGMLVKKCAEELGWKQSTTYTVLKKLSTRGFVQNEKSTVISLIGREQALRYESEEIVQKTFGGSLPSFIAAFFNGKKISEDEADELKALIDSYRK